MHTLYDNETSLYSDITNETESTNSDTNDNILKNVVKNMVKKHEKNLSENNLNESVKNSIKCNLCKNNGENQKFIILSCNHIFHINCLVQKHFKKIYDHPMIDNEYFQSCKCDVCNVKMEIEQIMYLHSTFISNTKILLKDHDVSIVNLEDQLVQLKKELKTLYDYKHKLEIEREKSKQITNILNTLI